MYVRCCILFVKLKQAHTIMYMCIYKYWYYDHGLKMGLIKDTSNLAVNCQYASIVCMTMQPFEL